MKRPTYITFAIIALAVMVVSVYSLRRYLPYTGIDLSPKQPPAVVFSMENAYCVGLGHKGKQWSARARHIEVGQNRSITRLTDIHDAKILDERGQTVATAKAGAAVYDTYSKDLQLSNGVQINGTRGQKLTATGAVWNSSTQSLRSIGQVDFQRDSTRLHTDRLQVNLRNKELEMWNVTMSFNLEEVTRNLREAR